MLKTMTPQDARFMGRAGFMAAAVAVIGVFGSHYVFKEPVGTSLIFLALGTLSFCVGIRYFRQANQASAQHTGLHD